VRVTAIITSHNRRESTLACLATLFSQVVRPEVGLDAVIVDDGSSDGTAAAVQSAFPRSVIVRGSGNLYWAGGMALAEQHAVASDPEYLLWLNDDVELEPHALETLLLVGTHTSSAPAIAVGAVADPQSGAVSYSGLRRVDQHPMHFARVVPDGCDSEIDVFNGNVVLVPRSVYTALSGIDPGFRHTAADFDYALRARALGFQALLAPSVVGTCRRGGIAGSWRDRSLPVRARWRLLIGVKGAPPRACARYLRRHGGRAWPLWWLATYLKFGLDVLGIRFRTWATYT
jgi:GT2 family glycosyltransferase